MPGAAVPLVGRRRERRLLTAAVDAGLAGRGAVVVIGGEAGIGKSRLVNEVVEVVRQHGAMAVVGRSWEAGGAPAFWPWAEVLRQRLLDVPPEERRALLGAGGRWVGVLVPEVLDEGDGGQPPDVSVDGGGGARFALFDAVAQLLRRASQARPTVVVLEDLHAADGPSLLLLRFVVRQLQDAGVVVIGTYREGEPLPGELLDVLGDVARASYGHHLVLDALSVDEVGELIGHVCGQPPAPTVAARIHRQTGGNALFVSEVVGLLADRGDVREALSGPLDSFVPPTLRAVIGQRLARLPASTVEVLELASVVGREFRIRTLEVLASLPVEVVLDRLDPALEGRVVTVVGPDVLRFSHELVRDALYQSLPSSRRIRLHQAIGELLEENAVGVDEATRLSELAHHFGLAAVAGGAAKAVAYGRLAGRAAVERFGYEDGVRLLAEAIRSGATVATDDPALVCELHLELGDAQARAGDLASAKATFRAAAAIARRHTLSAQLARAALGYGGRWVWSRAADDVEIVPLLREASAALGDTDSALQVRVLGRLACALRSERDRSVGATLAAEALAMAERLNDVETIAFAHDALLGARYWYDNPEERLHAVHAGSSVLRRSADPERRLDLQLATVSALLELGRLEEAERELGVLAHDADAIRQPAYQWMVASIRAMVALLRGDIGAAAAWMEQEQRLGTPAITAEAAAAHGSHVVWLRAQTGPVDGVVDEMRRIAERVWWYPMFPCFVAELSVDTGDVDGARALFEQLAADDFAALLPYDNEWLLSASVIADVCAALGDAERARTLYERITPVAHLNVVGVSELSRGAAVRCLGVLATTMRRYDDAAAHLAKALERNTGMGARPWVARTRWDLARMLIARDDPGDRDAAAHELALAADVAEEIGLAAMAARIRATSPKGARRAAPVASAVLRRDGDYWTVVFDGDAFRARHSKGLLHLAALLARPGREISALDLVGALPPRRQADSRDIAPANDGAGERLDARAKAEYQRRMRELSQEIDEATDWNDLARAERARHELDFLERELAGAFGLDGRARPWGSDSERARLNATRALRSAIDRLAEHSPSLGRHLRSTVRTGTFCAYVPDPRAPITWET